MSFLKLLSKSLNLNLPKIVRCFIRREEIKSNYNVSKKHYILLDRVKFILRLIFYPLMKIRFFSPKPKTFNMAYIDVFYNEDIIKTREFFIKYFDKDCESVGNISFVSENRFNINLQNWIVFFKLYFFFIYISFFSLFDLSKLKYTTLSDLFFNIIYYEINKSKFINLKKIYIFNSFDINSYFLAKYFENILSNEDYKVYFVIGNGNVDIHYKYDNSTLLNIIFTSKVQYQQALSLNQAGFFKNNPSLYKIYGDEKIIDVDRFDRTQKYDLSFFSSGFWARDKNSTWWDYDNIKEYNPDKNIYSSLEDEIIQFLVKYAKDNKLSLVLKTHPRDKVIIKEKNMVHPFEKYVDNKSIFLDKQENDLLFSNFFDSKIGVTVYSSIFYQRYNFDLPIYYFNSEDKKYIYQINTKFLDNCEKYSYSSINELTVKLDKVFKCVES